VVMISSKNDRDFIHDVSDLTLHIIFDARWASRNVGLKCPIVSNDSRYVASWRFYLHCTIEQTSSPGIICIICHKPLARTLLDSKPLLPSFAWWCRWVDRIVDLPYLPTGSGEKFFLAELTIVLMLTLLLGEMLDVSRYGQYRGKLRHLCQGWYVYSPRTKQNLPFDCQYNGNS